MPTPQDKRPKAISPPGKSYRLLKVRIPVVWDTFGTNGTGGTGGTGACNRDPFRRSVTGSLDVPWRMGLFLEAVSARGFDNGC